MSRGYTFDRVQRTDDRFDSRNGFPRRTDVYGREISFTAHERKTDRRTLDRVANERGPNATPTKHFLRSPE
ncbi:MAG: hypothetical protein BRD24_11725 [Halobacteriales archaeon SW_9_67_24]|nr:MAG: hypothetical protein BRD24_11725 [Halobacteriales archaeon SW_9_67_24]